VPNSIVLLDVKSPGWRRCQRREVIEPVALR